MDIQSTIRALLAAGFTQKAIADRVGCSQPTISDIALGKVGQKRPSYRLVRALEDLWAQTTVVGMPLKTADATRKPNAAP